MIKSDKTAGYMNAGPLIARIPQAKRIILTQAEKGIVIKYRDTGDVDRIEWSNIVKTYTDTGFVRKGGVFIELTDGTELYISGIRAIKDKEVVDILNSKSTGQTEDGWEVENPNTNNNKTKSTLNINKKQLDKLANTHLGPNVQQSLEACAKSGWSMDGTKLSDEQVENLNKQLFQYNNKDLTCPSCNSQNKKGSNFCISCGTELNNREISFSEKCCYNCGKFNEKSSKFCNSCGTSLEFL